MQDDDGSCKLLGNLWPESVSDGSHFGYMVVLIVWKHIHEEERTLALVQGMQAAASAAFDASADVAPLITPPPRIFAPA